MTIPGTLEQHPPDTLTPHPDNPRHGNVAAIAGSLRAHGQYKPLLVNRGGLTGRPMEVLAGNHTLQAVLELAEREPARWATVECWVVDVDDERATRLLLADNRTGEHGGMDDRLLLELLAGMDDLDGTGFDLQGLSDLERLMQLQDAAPTPPPGKAAEDSYDRYNTTDARQIVLVVSAGQYEPLLERLARAGERLGTEGTTATVAGLVAAKLGKPSAVPA